MAVNAFVNLKLSLLEANPETYARLLQRCGETKSLAHGKFVHEHMVGTGHDRDSDLSHHLLQMYIKCGGIDIARQVFDSIVAPSILSWTSMVTAYAQKGDLQEATALVRQMDLNGAKLDKTALRCMVDLCSQSGNLGNARQVRDRIFASGFSSEVALSNSLIVMFSDCGSLQDARSIFNDISRKNTVTWNFMLRAYIENGQNGEALKLYQEFLLQGGNRPNHIIFTTMLDMFKSREDLEEAKSVHLKIAELGFESHAATGNALIRMYGRCGSIEDARKVFDRLHKRDVVPWNTMVAAYTQSGQPLQALELFKSMESHYVQPDCTTFINVLCACEVLGDLENGKMVHKYAALFKLENDLHVATGLLNMYSKCGSLKDARLIFNDITSRDVVVWNSMISAYAQNGHAEEAIQLYKKMEVLPDENTFVAILEACEGRNWLSECCYYFSTMQQAGIHPGVKHCIFMVSLLGKSGWLTKSEELIEKMLLWNSEIIWTVLLKASQVHGDMERANRAAARILELQHEN